MGQSCNVEKVDFHSGGPTSAHRPVSSDTPSPKVKRPTAAAVAAWADEHEEPPLPTRIDTFTLLRRKREGRPPSIALEVPDTAYPKPTASALVARDHWRHYYRVSNELGRGVSAAVFEADASPASAKLSRRIQEGPVASMRNRISDTLMQPMIVCSRGIAVGSCMPERHRQVAIKRFKKVRSRSFQTELAAMLRVGVHPHVLRLLESYEDCEGEDVLILEFCEGSTVFDAYAAARQRSTEHLPETLVARMVRQLLLALEHINACGIEHQDVKPENMLLYDFNLDEQRAELKLGDFGWAVASSGVNGECPEVPADGAGSLWYAPPELNPPVASLGGRDGETFKRLSKREAGRSDMWSVGVVTYLLLVGHNPFHLAQEKGSHKAVEQEVLRIVALGQIDRNSDSWKRLQSDAHDFINQMLRVQSGDRISITEAIKHPYLLRRLRGCAEVAPLEPAWRWSDRDNAWARLDGFQKLSWVAVARAITEPELRRETVFSAARAARASALQLAWQTPVATETAYLWQLARELSSTPIGTWLRERRGWMEISRLAFRYLDGDCDGSLSARDIGSHISTSQSRADSTGGSMTGSIHQEVVAAVNVWILRWGQDDGLRPNAGLDISDFRAALAASPPNACAGDQEWDGDLPDEQEVDDREGCTSLGQNALRLENELICGWSRTRPHDRS